MTTTVFAIIGSLVAALIGSFGTYFMKVGSAKVTRKVFDNLYNFHLYIAVLFQLLSSLVFIFSLKFGEVSVLYPFAATTYIWTSILAVKYLGEKMNRYKWSGIVFILIGVSFIGVGA